MLEGFLLGAGITALIMCLIFMPMVERNRDFGMDMSDLYVAALDDISTLTKICGGVCESIKLKSPELHKEVMSKPVQ